MGVAAQRILTRVAHTPLSTRRRCSQTSHRPYPLLTGNRSQKNSHRTPRKIHSTHPRACKALQLFKTRNPLNPIKHPFFKNPSTSPPQKKKNQEPPPPKKKKKIRSPDLWKQRKVGGRSDSDLSRPGGCFGESFGLSKVFLAGVWGSIRALMGSIRILEALYKFLCKGFVGCKAV